MAEKMVGKRYPVYETEIEGRKIRVYANTPKEQWGYSTYSFFKRLLDKPYIASGIWIVPKDEKSDEGVCIIPRKTPRTEAWEEIAQEYEVEYYHLEDLGYELEGE